MCVKIDSACEFYRTQRSGAGKKDDPAEIKAAVLDLAPSFHPFTIDGDPKLIITANREDLIRYREEVEKGKLSKVFKLSRGEPGCRGLSLCEQTEFFDCVLPGAIDRSLVQTAALLSWVTLRRLACHLRLLSKDCRTVVRLNAL